MQRIFYLIKLLTESIKNFFSSAEVFYIVENKDWVIKEEASYIRDSIKNDIKIRITISPFGIYGKTLHFFSINTFIGKNGIKPFSKKNEVILTWYHFVQDDPRAKYIPEMSTFLKYIHSSCLNTKNSLLEKGFPEEKIKIIYQGIDHEKFPAVFGFEKRKPSKLELGLPLDKVIISSFQKDGNGWEEGLEPKLIKGPDIFCDVVEKLSQEFPIHVLLTAPARGYVINRLKEADIGYTHHILEDYTKIATYFHATDLYIVASRIEGGPKAIIESWSTGTPLVTTRVGLANDLVKNKENAMMTEVEDVQKLYEHAKYLLQNPEEKNTIVKNGYDTSLQYSFKSIGQKYLEELYR